MKNVVRVEILKSKKNLNKQVENGVHTELLASFAEADDFWFQVTIVDVFKEEILFVSFLEAVHKGDNVGVGKVWEDVCFTVSTGFSLKAGDVGKTLFLLFCCELKVLLKSCRLIAVLIFSSFSIIKSQQ